MDHKNTYDCTTDCTTVGTSNQIWRSCLICLFVCSLFVGVGAVAICLFVVFLLGRCGCACLGRYVVVVDVGRGGAWSVRLMNAVAVNVSCAWRMRSTVRVGDHPDLLASGSESVRDVLTDLYEVLAKAEAFSKEKEQEAERANVRVKALEQAVIYGNFGGNCQGNRDGDVDFAQGTDAVQLFNDAVAEVKAMEKAQYANELQALAEKVALLEKEKEALSVELIDVKKDLSKCQKDFVSELEIIKKDAAAEWQLVVDNSVRAECSRMKEWARDWIAKKEKQLHKHFEAEIESRRQHAYDKGFEAGRGKRHSVAATASMKERISQQMKKKTAAFKAEMEREVLDAQEELDAVRAKMKIAEGERDASRSALRTYKRKCVKELDSLKEQLHAEKEQRNKLKKHHRGEMQKLHLAISAAKKEGKQQRSLPEAMQRSHTGGKEENAALRPAASVEKTIQGGGNGSASPGITIVADEKVHPASPLAVVTAVAVSPSSATAASPTPTTPGGFFDFDSDGDDGGF